MYAGTFLKLYVGSSYKGLIIIYVLNIKHINMIYLGFGKTFSNTYTVV